MSSLPEDSVLPDVQPGKVSIGSNEFAVHYEISHRRDITWSLCDNQAYYHILGALNNISWIAEVPAIGIRQVQLFRPTHLYCFTRRTFRCDISLCTTPKALLQLASNRWSIEGWHSIPDTQLHEVAQLRMADTQACTSGRLRVSRYQAPSCDRGFRNSDPPPAFSGFSDLTLLPEGDVGLLVESGDLHLKRSPGTGRKLLRHNLIAFRRIPLSVP